MTNLNKKYAVAWMSVTGFANDGWYLYGETDGLNSEFLEWSYAKANNVFTILSSHRTFEGAEREAEKRCNRVRKSYKEARMAYAVSCESLEDYLEQKQECEEKAQAEAEMWARCVEHVANEHRF